MTIGDAIVVVTCVLAAFGFYGLIVWLEYHDHDCEDDL